MSDAAARIAKLSPDRLRRLAKKVGDGKRVRPVARPRDRAEYPLSFGQERIWLLSQLSDNSPLYNNPLAALVRTNGPLSIELLSRAMAVVAARHEILRTTFHLRGGEPCQVIAAGADFPVAYDDLRSLPADERLAAARDIARTEALTPLALDSLPLVRLRIAQLDNTEYAFLITPHHIVSDGWSNGMMIQELSTTYETLAAGDQPAVTPPGLQIVDLALWEREWVSSSEGRRDLEWWTRRLAGVQPVSLIEELRRPTTMDFRGALVTRALSPTLVRRIRDAAPAHRVTVYQLLLTALDVLIHRCTGEIDITIGTPVANRDSPDAQRVMGPVINTVALRTRIDPAGSFADALATVKADCLASFQRQRYPFERLIEAMQPKRDLASPPFFRLLFVHQYLSDLYDVPHMRVERFRVDYGLSKFDINLWAEDLDAELMLYLTFRTGVFRPDTMERFLARYEHLLGRALADPDTPVAELPLEAPTPTAPAPPAPRPTTVLDGGPTMAVRCGDILLDRDEFGRRSDALAAALVDAGVRREEPVVVLLERSADFVIALVAVQKAGGTPVPIEASTRTEERTRAILDDCGARLVVADRQLDELADLEIVSPNAAGAGPLPVVDPDQLAYVVYTSGTTGRPKGVAVEHRSLAHYIDAVLDRMNVGERASFATVTSLAADLSYTMVFGALRSSGTLLVVREDDAVDPASLAAWFEPARPDVMKTVPSHLDALFGADPSDSILPTRLLVLGGEALPRRLVEEVRRRRPGLRILNHYGPAEATIGILANEVPLSLPTADTVGLGSPLGASRVDIVGADGRTVPLDVPGEIMVAGPSVCRGYLGGGLVVDEVGRYHTGDRAILRTHGLYFLGRTDDQLKIRGHRVEPAGIERLLRDHPRVDTAAVVAGSGPTLVAAYTGAAALDEVRAYLNRCLHVVPDRIVSVPMLPLTPNGKLDRDALGALEPAGEGDGVDARDEYELALVRLWESLLPVNRIGIDDDFFELGGHSLLALGVITGIREAFGVTLPLATLFEHPTIRALARPVRQGEWRAADEVSVPLRSDGDRRPLTLIHPAGGDVMCYQPLVAALDDGRAVRGLRAVGVEDRIEDLADRYLASAGADHVQGGWSMGALVAFELASRLRTHAVILDQPAPRPDESPLLDDAERLWAYAQKVEQSIGRTLGLDEMELRAADPRERTACFLDAFVRNDIVPEETNLDGFQLFLDRQGAHVAAAARYRPPTHPGPVLVIRAADNPENRPVDLGWRPFVSGNLTVRDVAGDHFSMMTRPHVASVAKALDDWLGSV